MYRMRRSASSEKLIEERGEVVELPEADALPVLREGDVVGGQGIAWSSNGTFLVYLDAGPGKYLRAIYKPRSGERPLHDFRSGSLYKREYAAYLLGRELGWPRVPLTLIRDGPYGVGSVQLYVDSDPRITYFDLHDDKAEELLPLAVFDVLANNADRKGGHCLLGNDGQVWSIDHGLTFHHLFKLRTVMLEFWGLAIPKELLADMEALGGRLESKDGGGVGLAELLTEREVAALLGRLDVLLKNPIIPRLDPGRNVPWPLV